MKLKELFFTGLYSGYFPFAPGTAGTLVGMAVYVIEYLIFGENCWIANAVVLVLMLYPSIVVSDYGEKFFSKKDPPQVVIDEIIGYWISVLIFPFDWHIAVLAFIIFRIIDILKPFPAKRLQKLKGGLGIMVDDVVAGIYTNLIIIGLLFFLEKNNILIYNLP